MNKHIEMVAQWLAHQTWDLKVTEEFKPAPKLTVFLGKMLYSHNASVNPRQPVWETHLKAAG